MIIGGTLLTGGRGTIIGSLLGVLVFSTITNLFVLNNLATEVQNIAKGVHHHRRGAPAATSHPHNLATRPGDTPVDSCPLIVIIPMK